MSYVEGNLHRHILSAVNTGMIENYGRISVGDGFTIFDEHGNDGVYTFPVYDDEELILVFSVWEDNGVFRGSLSRGITKELRVLLSRNDFEGHLFYLKRKLVAVTTKGEEIQLSSIDESITRKTGNSSYNFSKSNIVLPSGTFVDISPIKTKGINIEENMGSKRYISDIYLNTRINETQSGVPWCSAFATSMVMRYKSLIPNDTSAEDIMLATHPYPYSEDLENQVLHYSEIIAYANEKGSYPSIKFYKLPDSYVMERIRYNGPVYISGPELNVDNPPYHAFVIRGFSSLNETYSIWNPWNNFYISMDQGVTTIPTGYSRKFKWTRTIYNW